MNKIDSLFEALNDIKHVIIVDKFYVGQAAIEAESELRALLAERDALREGISKLRLKYQVMNELPSLVANDYAQGVADTCSTFAGELQSILNATPAGEDLRVSEGEQT